MTKEILITGFGGQGILFAGKFLAYCGLIDKKEISWLPSYGPEMRGGTANCSVCISDTEISSPLVTAPDILVAMNQPSFEKFSPKVRYNGTIFTDSTLINVKQKAKNISYYSVPATQLSSDKKIFGTASIILTAMMINKCGLFRKTTVTEAIKKCISSGKPHHLEANLKAIKIGFGI